MDKHHILFPKLEPKGRVWHAESRTDILRLQGNRLEHSVCWLLCVAALAKTGSSQVGLLLLQQVRHVLMQFRSWMKYWSLRPFKLHLSGGSLNIKLCPMNTKSSRNL